MKVAEVYPKGALNVRRKRSKGKEHVYHYLVRREREKCRQEIRAYKKRMAYLE